MGLIVGPTLWWQTNLPSICPVGTTLPDGSKIICKAGGTAWIVAPSCTQATSAWAGGQYNATLVGDKCCVSEWPQLQSLLLSCGFNPSDWFVPSCSQINNPGFVCRSQWDSFSSSYWSSTESSLNSSLCISMSTGALSQSVKGTSLPVRVLRTVTY